MSIELGGDLPVPTIWFNGLPYWSIWAIGELCNLSVEDTGEVLSQILEDEGNEESI